MPPLNIILRNSPNAAFTNEVVDFIRKSVQESEGSETKNIKTCLIKQYTSSELKQYDEAMASTQDCRVRFFDDLLSFSEFESHGPESQLAIAAADIEKKYIRGDLVPCRVPRDVNTVLYKVSRIFDLEENDDDFSGIGGFVIELIAPLGGKMSKNLK